MASQTVCAPITHQTTEFHNTHTEREKLGHGLAKRLHGLTEKLQDLGHHRHDSGGGDSGRRSRAGRLLMLKTLPCNGCGLQGFLKYCNQH